MPEELWRQVEPLLPVPPTRRRRYPGRFPADDRAALAGLVFVLKTGLTWRELPREVAGVSGVTCGRRLWDWAEAGFFSAVHELLLNQLRVLEQLDLATVVVDGSHVRVLKGRRALARRSGSTRLETPCDHRRWWHPVGSHVDRRESS